MTAYEAGSPTGFFFQAKFLAPGLLLLLFFFPVWLETQIWLISGLF